MGQDREHYLCPNSVLLEAVKLNQQLPELSLRIWWRAVLCSTRPPELKMKSKSSAVVSMNCSRSSNPGEPDQPPANGASSSPGTPVIRTPHSPSYGAPNPADLLGRSA